MGFEDFLGPPGEEGAMPAKDIRTAIRLLFSPGPAGPADLSPAKGQYR
jgi:hypothetical protein